MNIHRALTRYKLLIRYYLENFAICSCEMDTISTDANIFKMSEFLMQPFTNFD